MTTTKTTEFSLPISPAVAGIVEFWKTAHASIDSMLAVLEQANPDLKKLVTLASVGAGTASILFPAKPCEPIRDVLKFESWWWDGRVWLWRPPQQKFYRRR